MSVSFCTAAGGIHHHPQAERGNPSVLKAAALAAALVLPGLAQAVEFGPFSLTGFAKVESQLGTNGCKNCQWEPGEDKQRFWADDVIPGARYKTEESTVTLFQPFLGAKFDLGQGYQLSGLLSQRWRDGKVDIEGFWYEKNIAISHEDRGSLRVGAMTSRAWSIADYPYGTNVGVADAWASSGAGYGLNTEAVRYTTPLFDVAGGDLALELTYDQGNTKFKKNKPRFLEFYAQYTRRDLTVEAMVQDTRNGTPSAWSHGPFTGLTPHPQDDPKLGGSGQSIAMAMARYQVNPRLEVSGGVRRNRWSGAYARITDASGEFALWNNMFNVDWKNDLGGGVFRGYSAKSTDFMLGARYKVGNWTASTGMVHLGKATTANPSERGQSNSATINTVGLNYDFRNGWQAYGMAGMVHYRRLGLSPLSMPSNSAFTNVDSRVNKKGNWFGAGALYVF